VSLAARGGVQADPDLGHAGRQRPVGRHDRLDPADASALEIDGEVEPYVLERAGAPQTRLEPGLVREERDGHRIRVDHLPPLVVDLVAGEGPKQQARAGDRDRGSPVRHRLCAVARGVSIRRLPIMCTR